ncbi:hypothetical protein MJ559_13115 [Klebsiella pneumoniae]|nr:hypothetical protein MJ559_13115 [Klebsiella pneumoniae]
MASAQPTMLECCRPVHHFTSIIAALKVLLQSLFSFNFCPAQTLTENLFAHLAFQFRHQGFIFILASEDG